VAGNNCLKFGNAKFAEQGFLTAKKSWADTVQSTYIIQQSK